MTQHQQQIETTILMALFQCTVEQSTHLTGTLKMKPKQDFVVWQNHGFKMLEHWEKNIPDFKEHIQKVADAIHSALSECKEQKEVGHGV
jgi:hypothetical protein